jgi:threonine synthase
MEFTTLNHRKQRFNAMDVGNPSNFIRIQEMYHNDLEHSKKDFSSYTPLQMRETTEANETYFTK